MAAVSVYVPTRGRVWHQTAARLGQYSPTYVHCNTGVVDARRIIVASFLETEADILVMCDDDVVPPENWGEIAAHVIAGRTDVCGAVAPICLEGTVFLPNVFERDDSLDKGYKLDGKFISYEGLQEVDAVGTGLMAIHRRVLEDPRLRDPFKANFIDGHGEDLLFCRRAKAQRYRVCVDFGVWCDHRVEVHANGIANAYMQIVNRAFDETSQ